MRNQDHRPYSNMNENELFSRARNRDNTNQGKLYIPKQRFKKRTQ